MRLLVVLASFIVSLTFGSSTNRPSSEDGHVLVNIDEAAMEALDRKTLTKAAKVLESFGKAKLEYFGKKFFKIHEDELITAMQGFLYVARFKAGLLEFKDQKTIDILNDVIDEMLTMAEKVYSEEKVYFNQTDMNKDTSDEAFRIIQGDLNGVQYYVESGKAKIYELYFNAYVVSPVNKTTHAMMAYLRDNSSLNQDQFIEQFEQNTATEYIMREAGNILKNTIDGSRFSRQTFDVAWSNITIYYFQAFLLEGFKIGLLPTQEDVMNALEKNMQQFLDNKRNLSKIYKEMNRYFYNSYFPGFIRQDIIRPVIDVIGDDNCKILEKIAFQLDSKFPWRRYEVIVADSVSRQDQYAYFGFPKRMIIEEDYNGKTVIVFMATKNSTKYRESYLKENGRQKVIEHAKEKFDTNDLNKVLAYARNGEKNYQMVVIKKIYRPCFPPLNSYFSDAFDMEVNGTSHFPNENKLGVAVIF